MILFDNLTDKNFHTAQGVGMIGSLIGMILWLFPLQIWTGVLGFFLTLFTTASSLFVTLVITGLYQRNKEKILNYFEFKISKRLKNGKKKDNDKAA